MGLADYFKTVDTMTPDEVRAFIEKHRPGDYNLVDVRQPKEYEQAHLPGSRLIPVAELDPAKPTIAY